MLCSLIPKKSPIHVGKYTIPVPWGSSVMGKSLGKFRREHGLEDPPPKRNLRSMLTCSIPISTLFAAWKRRKKSTTTTIRKVDWFGWAAHLVNFVQLQVRYCCLSSLLTASTRIQGQAFYQRTRVAPFNLRRFPAPNGTARFSCPKNPDSSSQCLFWEPYTPPIHRFIHPSIGGSKDS